MKRKVITRKTKKKDGFEIERNGKKVHEITHNRMTRTYRSMNVHLHGLVGNTNIEPNGNEYLKKKINNNEWV